MATQTIEKTNWGALTIPVALIGILVIFIIPLPPLLLDVFLALNITVGMMMLFASLYIERPLEFSTYPALLLVTTLFRLAINIATTRLILLYGDQGVEAAGDVIKAFGEFVVGGNYSVGIVIFIAISLVNVKVITKGSGRIAEVAARFTLDAMPGKQMAIDSDLNSGLINESEAKKRRKDMELEAEFYGSMDGAAKFVSGDAVAGMFLTGINIIGGLFIGIFQKGMPWQDAATTYTLLTIGDGLVSQIPAIIISTSAGLIVARASNGKDLSLEVGSQLTSHKFPLLLTSAACLGFALIPGLPFIPFAALSIGTAGISFYQRQQKLERKKSEKPKGDKGKSETAADGKETGTTTHGLSTEEVLKLLSVDSLELEIGFELIPLIEKGDLVERIRAIRKQFALEIGFVIPSIHIKDNVKLKSNEYQFLLKGNVIGASSIRPHYSLAIDSGTGLSLQDGIPTKEPAFGLDAYWIPERAKEEATLSGYTVVDSTTVIITHITELLRSHVHELLGRQETQSLVDNVREDNPKVVEDLIPTELSLGAVQSVLVRLLREHISIRDLKTILEALSNKANQTKSIEQLTEHVRKALKRTISSKFASDGSIHLINFNPGLENALVESLSISEDGSFIGIEPGIAQQIINQLQNLSKHFLENGYTPLILTSATLRPALANFVERFAPGYSVISHLELAPNLKIHSYGVVNA